MPSNILIIENSTTNISCYKSFLSSNLKIQHKILTTFDSLEDLLLQNNYTHLILNAEVDPNWEEKYTHLISLPTLVISNINYNDYYVINEPLTFDKVFNFLCITSSFSCNTINEYALGEEDIFNELINQIQIEFEENYNLLPEYINNQNLEEIKSRSHQISSKFSLLEMNDSYKNAKEIDTHILDDPKSQINNCNNLLVDIAIVINLLKN